MIIAGPFTTAQAAKFAGFKSSSMVDYLCRAGILVPSLGANPGRGRSRLYTFGEVVLLRALNRLLESRLPVARLKEALERQQKDFRYLTAEGAIRRFLITDGCDVFLEDEPGRLVNLNKDGQMAFAFVVDVEHARRDVIRMAEATRQRFRGAKRSVSSNKNVSK
jgi:hypothetical protein